MTHSGENPQSDGRRPPRTDSRRSARTDGGESSADTEPTSRKLRTDGGGLRVAGVVGSLADESVTRVAVTRALRAAEQSGVETDLIDPRRLELPMYDDDRPEPPDAARLTERLRAADAIVLGTPVYHGSYSSPLKTILDYSGFDEFRDVTVGLVAVSGGAFPITALDHLRSVLRSLNAWVLPFQAAVPNSKGAVSWPDDIDEDADPAVSAQFTDDGIDDRVGTLGRRVVEYANIEPEPMSFEGQQNRGAD